MRIPASRSDRARRKFFSLPETFMDQILPQPAVLDGLLQGIGQIMRIAGLNEDSRIQIGTRATKIFQPAGNLYGSNPAAARGFGWSASRHRPDHANRWVE